MYVPSYIMTITLGVQTTKLTQAHPILSRMNLTCFNIGLAESSHVML